MDKQTKRRHDDETHANRKFCENISFFIVFPFFVLFAMHAISASKYKNDTLTHNFEVLLRGCGNTTTTIKCSTYETYT